MFSKIYLKQPAGQAQESERLRNRIARFAWDRTGNQDDVRARFVRYMEQETGARVSSDMGGPDVERFFRECEMRDLLDAITCMAAALGHGGDRRLFDAWVAFCKLAFAEEGMAYRIDDDGVAHYLVDAAFHETADSVVAALSGGRYAAAGAAVNKAVEELTRAHPNGKHAIRDAFEGVETAFKVTTDSNKDLASTNIAALLTPIVNRRFADGDQIAQGAATQTLESLRDWTNACHKYRHGHNLDELTEPPLDLTILLVGNGLNFARWLAALAAIRVSPPAA